MSETWGPTWLTQNERPARLGDVSFADLSPTLRLLLTWEGLLANALEAVRRTAILADVEGHEEMRLDADHARWLQALPQDRALGRRTALREKATGRLIVHADVVLLPSRLPEQFLEVLAEQPSGIGGALAQLKIATRRELLWFGRTPLRGLRDGDRALAGDSAVSRCFRLIADGVPIGVFEESFPDAVFASSPGS